MEGLNALTPNTAAFLDSLTMGDLSSSTTNAGFPPSAFFPVPGRDTPEDSSPDSVAEAKPKMSIVSDDSDQDVPTNHKRKAQNSNETVDDDDDEDSMSEGGHEDKRHHKGAGRRKSNDKTKGDKPPKDNLTKAQRRKEQNRAAQKAFRERREAKVRDLEQKVAELEAKSFGASVENENLRGILRRLQEENMALKQSHFTFSMPVNGVPAATGQQTPTQTNPSSGIDWSTFSNFKAQTQVPKPPSPPQSVNEQLRSIHDPSPVHRSSVGSIDNSPESLVSINGPSPASSSERTMPSLFGLNSSAPTPGMPSTLPRHNSSSSPSDILSTPSSIGGNKDDVEALFRSLYPNGIDAVLANATNATNYGATGLVPSGPQPLQPTVQSPYTFLGSSQGLMSSADSSSNALAKLFGDATSYRETTTSVPQMSFDLSSGTLPSLSKPQNVSSPLASQAAWSNVTDNSVNEFLASLAGTNAVDTADLSAVDDDIFSRQIEALISAQAGNASPSAAFNLPNSAFSPTAYINMSPSPLQSISNSQTPQSTTGTSSVTSPQTDISSATSAGEAPLCGASDIIHVVGDDGRVMRPSEVWTKMGMHNTTGPGEVMIDDLCDQMKTKATCKDGRRYMKYEDVQHMVKSREDKGTSRFGARDNATMFSDLPDTTPPNKQSCADKAYHDPAECQARLNAAFVEANGGL